MLRVLLGVASAVAVCGVATAQPPRGPLSEARELDPVVRDYYHGQAPTPPAAPAEPSRDVPARGDARAWAVAVNLLIVEAVLSEITMSLGPCMTPDM